ncbi:MAG: PilZ domain-containing protein [Leptospiraceae bacterium]|nr:PilZ domain-containing protein [Leptospiraceae bacterium]
MSQEQIRQNQRYYFQNKSQFIVKVEMSAGRFVECMVSDISVSGVCIILDKQVFLARGKEYPLEIIEKLPDGNLETVTQIKGTVIWNLTKDFRNLEMIFMGIQFQNLISLPNSVISEEEVSI